MLSHLQQKAEGGGFHRSPNKKVYIYFGAAPRREWELTESVFGQSLGLTTGSSQIFLGQLD
ncbi:hypothetical protein ACE6H2_019480 [Prunus campanulata]